MGSSDIEARCFPMLSRRQFLISSGILLAGGAIGSSQLLQDPSTRYRLGLEQSPDADVPETGTTVEYNQLSSRHMNRTVGWALSLPTVAPRATVFCLHGRSGDERSAFETLRLHDMVATAQLPLAIASVAGGKQSYWHQRLDGSDALTMVIDELIPAVEERTGTTQRALYGWSMGGFGALLTAASHPQDFRATVAISPALWTDPGKSPPDAFDGIDDFARHDVFAMRDRLSAVDIRISCGTDDPFYQATKAFVSGLTSVEADFSDGYHDNAYFRSVSPKALQFITRAVTT